MNRVKLTWKWGRPKLWNVASANGLDYSREDPFDLVHMTVDFFGRGDQPRFQNIVWGSWRGFPSIEADIRYTGARLGAKRGSPPHSLAIVGLDARLAHVRISPTLAPAALVEPMGSGGVSFESEEFNQRYQVECDDPEDAFKLIDARMMQWLLLMPHECVFETNGTKFAVFSFRDLTGALVTLLGAAKAFSERIPRIAWGEPGPADNAHSRGAQDQTHARALVESSPFDASPKRPGEGPAAAPDLGTVFEAPGSS